MNVLITGAFGWLGKALTETISKHHNVRAFGPKRQSSWGENVQFDGEVVLGSVADFETVHTAVAGQDAVVHAAITRTRPPEMYTPGDPTPFETNVRGTYNVMDASKQAGVGRVILIGAAETHVEHPPGTFIDSTSMYRGRGSPYDLTKLLQEETCRWFCDLHGMDVISLRCGDILDLRTGLGKREGHWDMSVRTGSWIDRRDIAEACLRCLEIEHTGYDVFHLVGAPSAKRWFDVARAEALLGMTFTTEFDRRPADERQ